MNSSRILAASVVLLIAASAALAAGFEHPGGESHERGPARQSGYRGGGPHVIYKMHEVAVPKPNPAPMPNPALRNAPAISYPRHDERGAAIVKPAAGLPPQQHVRVVRNTPLVQGIQAQQRAEVVPQRFYWHEERGVRYAHYLDGEGRHWYGFYHGPAFYWTRFHNDRWWWFDARFGRWVYWWDGFWWWPGPAGVEYVYVDNAYYPYQQPGMVTVQNPEVQPAPTVNPAPGEGQAFTSPDGTRVAQIFGEQSDAFLYDQTGPQPRYLGHLGQGVDKVRFELSADKKTLRILVDFKDGNYSIFDANGAPLATPEVSPEETPGAPPEEVPPAPTSAPPGQ